MGNTTNTVLIHSVENIGLPYNNKHGTNLTTLSLPTSFIIHSRCGIII